MDAAGLLARALYHVLNQRSRQFLVQQVLAADPLAQ